MAHKKKFMCMKASGLEFTQKDDQKTFLIGDKHE